MKDIKEEIEKILENLNNLEIRSYEDGIIIPIYYGYDDEDKIFFDVDSIRYEVNLLLDRLEDYNCEEDEE
jgi:hypothetical protein